MISGTELLIKWLSPLGEVGPQRGPGAQLPFRLVQRVAGYDDKVTDTGIYQVHTFSSTFEEGERQAALTHERMLRLGPPLSPQQRVQISTGIVFVDSVTTSQSPIWVQYTEAAPVVRFVASYTVQLRLPSVYTAGS